MHDGGQTHHVLEQRRLAGVEHAQAGSEAGLQGLELTGELLGRTGAQRGAVGRGGDLGEPAIEVAAVEAHRCRRHRRNPPRAGSPWNGPSGAPRRRSSVHCTIMPRVSRVSRITRTAIARGSAPGRRRSSQVFKAAAPGSGGSPAMSNPSISVSSAWRVARSYRVQHRAGRNALERAIQPCRQLQDPPSSARRLRQSASTLPWAARVTPIFGADIALPRFENSTIWFRHAFKRRVARKKRRVGGADGSDGRSRSHGLRYLAICLRRVADTRPSQRRGREGHVG